MADTNSFFSFNNTVLKLTDKDVAQTTDYLAAIKAFARTTYQSVYVIDYEKKGFEFVADNPLFLCGHSSAEVEAMGYDFYFKYVPEEDLQLLLTINTAGFEFYERLPIEERKEYTIAYDFHLITDEGKCILIHQKLTPLYLTEKGEIWKAICIVSLATAQQAGNIVITKKDGSKRVAYDLASGCWITLPKVELSIREKEILQYAIRGYAIHEIAEKIFISPDTVKFHRKKLFDKLGVANIHEAIIYATTNKLL